MKFMNLTSTFSLVLLMCITIFSSCTKEDVQPEDQVTTDEVSVDAIDVKVIDNTLVFNSQKDFDKAYKIVTSEDKDAINAWANSLDFKSIYSWYEDAFEALCCDVDEDMIKSVQRDFEGKAIISDEGDVTSLQNAGSLTRFMNTDGMFKIRESIIMVQGNKMISIPDGDQRKLAKALTTLEQDVDNDIFIHDIVKEDSRTYCNWTQEQEKEVTSGGKRYRYKSKIQLQDLSFVVYNDPFFGTFYTIIFEIYTNLNHKRKRWIGWGCERRYHTWGMGYQMFHNLNNYGISLANPLSGGTGWTSGHECDFNHHHGIIYEPFVSYSAYIGGGVTNLDRLGQNASVTGPSISLSTYCD